MPHRTLEQWQELQAKMAAESAVIPPVAEGHLRVSYKTAEGVRVYVEAPTVEHLKAAGYRVVITHRRYKERRSDLKYISLRKEEKAQLRWQQTAAKGGATHVFVLAPEHGAWGEGYVVCMASDPYSKKVGYCLAVNQALNQLNRK